MNDEPQFSAEEPTIPTKHSNNNNHLGVSGSSPGVSSSGGMKGRRGRPSIMSIDDIQGGGADKQPRPSSAEAPKASFRGWEPTSQFADPHQMQAASFNPTSIRVMSYNVLASRYVSTDKYRFCPTWALSEPYRCAGILQEIATSKPDIIFFQELSSELHKSQYFGEKLRSAEFDYESFHVPISNKQGKSHAAASSGSGVADSMGSNGSYTLENQAPRVVRASGGASGGVNGTATFADDDNNNSNLSNTNHGASSGFAGGLANSGASAGALNSTELRAGGGGIPIAEDCTRPEFEGVAIFYNKSRYEQKEHLPVKFNVLAENDPDLQPAEKKRLICSSHNVAIISVLVDKQTDDALICAGTHAYWDWSRPECQQWQMVKMLQEIEALEGAYQDMGHTTRVIVGGDFNSERNGASIQYALNKKVPENYPPSVTFPGYKGIFHSLELQNSYEEYCARHEKHVTSTGPSFQGVIDYVFADTSLQVVAVAKLAGAVEMPQAVIPSDHYPVGAILLPRPGM